MKARDVMVSPVITVKPYFLVREVAKMLVENRISALPVVDDGGKLVGIVSEGDLMHRSEVGTERNRSWWLRLMVSSSIVAADYVKAYGRKVADVMTQNVLTATPETPLNEIATLLERNSIKRVPIVRDGQLVGIVSRANLVQAIAGAPKGLEIPLSDSVIRDRLLDHLRAQPWTHTWLLNVTINDGVVNLWGITNSEEEKNAIRVAAETIDGVRAVKNHLVLLRRDYELA
jgi:CBS domain-containing protein